MTRKGGPLWIGAGAGICTVAALAFAVHGAAAGSKPYTTWSEYGGSADSSQYSALTQINKNNVRQLDVAWFYHVGGEPDRMPFNPLIVNDVIYVSGEKSVVVALNPETGKECADAGATWFVAGSAIFGADDPIAAYHEIAKAVGAE